MTSRGFTLAEILVATAIAGAAAALMSMTLLRQQRLYASAGVVLGGRSQLRDAADVLVTDIRGAAVASLGLPLMSDTAIEMFTTVGTSVACTAPAGTTIGLPPAALVSGNTLTSIITAPDTGDLALVYGFPAGQPDSGKWEVHRIISFASRALTTSCPASSGFTTTADAFAGATAYMLTLATMPGANVRKGAPIHFLRRARYSLYKSSDAAWYLGYRRCNADAPGCAAIQPVSGPYRPYRAAGNANGLSFRYYDAAGTELNAGAASTSLARVDIVLRGATSVAASMTGDATSAWQDSAIVSVSPRNRFQ